MKKFLVLFVLTLSVFTLSACVKTTEPNDDEEPYDIVDAIETDTTHIQYSTNSTQDIFLLNIPVDAFYMVTDLLGNELLLDDVIQVKDYYEIQSDYVLSLDRDVVAFYFYYGEYKTLVEITMNNKTTPYIISSSVVTTTGTNDQLFQFETFEGTIKQVTGENLTTSDYLIVENILQINASYITSAFSANDHFTIDYVLEDENLTLGLIVFNKD